MVVLRLFSALFFIVLIFTYSFTFVVFSAEFAGQIHYTDIGITPSGAFVGPGHPECPGDGKRKLSHDYQL